MEKVDDAMLSLCDRLEGLLWNSEGGSEGYTMTLSIDDVGFIDDDNFQPCEGIANKSR